MVKSRKETIKTAKKKTATKTVTPKVKIEEELKTILAASEVSCECKDCQCEDKKQNKNFFSKVLKFFGI